MSGVWLDMLGVLLILANLSIVGFMIYFAYEKRKATKRLKQQRKTEEKDTDMEASVNTSREGDVELTTVTPPRTDCAAK